MGFSWLIILLKIVYIFFCLVAQASKSFQVIVLICICHIVSLYVQWCMVGFSHVLSLGILKWFLGSMTSEGGVEYFVKWQAQSNLTQRLHEHMYSWGL